MNGHSPQSVGKGLSFALSHTVITLLAIGTAFGLPELARYVLFYWWPQVEANSHFLLTTEILFAAVLAMLLNLALTSLDNRRYAESAKLASLAYARRGGWNDSWRERRFMGGKPVSRDAFVMAVTGFHAFVDTKGFVGTAFKSAYEIRVMLIDPMKQGGQAHVGPPRQAEDLTSRCREIEASIRFLDGLRRSGKKVTLKLYDEAPFWNLVILGEHTWVQYCHDGLEPNDAPAYVFALNSRTPAQGLFLPFYVIFLNKWNDPRHPEYDFERRELIYRDELGNETGREPFVLSDERRATDAEAGSR